MTPAQRDRYLDALGLPVEAPSPGALGRLIEAHLDRFPFENISKLIRARRGLAPGLPSIEDFLTDHERLGTGGTCYVLGSHFNDLLRTLGYDAVLAGADMSEPDQHMVNVVHLDGRAHLVDVGYAAPLFAPLPLHAEGPLAVDHGDHRYVLQPRTPDGRHRLDEIHGGQVIHGYWVKPRPRRLEEFAAVVEASFRADAFFMNLLRVVTLRPTGKRALRDRTANLFEGRERRTVEFESPDALLTFVATTFGIAPVATAEACAALAARSHPLFAGWR